MLSDAVPALASRLHQRALRAPRRRDRVRFEGRAAAGRYRPLTQETLIEEWLVLGCIDADLYKSIFFRILIFFVTYRFYTLLQSSSKL